MDQAYLPERSRARVWLPSVSADTLIAIATLLFILFWVAFSLYMQTPPGVVPATATPGEFSAARAFQHVERIASSPHPMGSAAHAEVRDYLLKELSAAGLSPEVQQATGVSRDWGATVRAGAVQNISARLAGTERTGKALLLVAHYDSRPNSYGASDDGAGVAALLETLRALKAGAPLKNDVIFLFTDGEEDGMLGAQAFVKESALMKEVGLVLNFEARGNGGPSIMFETSERNGWLVEQFAQASPRPVAHSLAYEIYKILPNDTDLTVFRKAGLPGLNFAYINGLPHYHTLLDNRESLDQRSLQHHGSYALALARHFGNLSLDNTERTNAVYFDLLGSVMVRYPNSLIIPLTAITVLLMGGLVFVGLRRKHLTIGGMVWGVLALLVCLGVTPVVVSFLWSFLRRWQDATVPGGTYQSALFMAGFVALAVALTSALYALLRRRVSTENLTAGALFWWIVLLVIVSLYLPGGSYLLTWPLLFGLAGLGLMLWAKGKGIAARRLWLPLAVCAIPGVILFVPVVYQTFNALTLNRAGILTGLVVLLVGSLVPQLSLITTPRKWLLPGAAAVVAASLLIVGSAKTEISARQPKQDSLFYGLNADTGKAVWASNEERADEWTAKFLTDGAKDRTLPDFFNSDTDRLFLVGEATPASLPAPSVALLDDRTEGGMRTLRLRITSARNAAIISLYADSGTKILKSAVNGRSLDEDSAPQSGDGAMSWSMRYYALPADGIELTCETPSTQPFKIRAVDQTFGLPDAAPRTRPEHIVPSTIPITDTTFVSKSFTF
jgi:Peptidase family M28